MRNSLLYVPAQVEFKPLSWKDLRKWHQFGKVATIFFTPATGEDSLNPEFHQWYQAGRLRARHQICILSNQLEFFGRLEQASCPWWRSFFQQKESWPKNLKLFLAKCLPCLIHYFFAHLNTFLLTPKKAACFKLILFVFLGDSFMIRICICNNFLTQGSTKSGQW